MDHPSCRDCKAIFRKDCETREIEFNIDFNNGFIVRITRSVELSGLMSHEFFHINLPCRGYSCFFISAAYLKITYRQMERELVGISQHIQRIRELINRAAGTGLNIH